MHEPKFKLVQGQEGCSLKCLVLPYTVEKTERPNWFVESRVHRLRDRHNVHVYNYSILQ